MFKKNDKTSVDNYRPFSILSIISKIVERVVYDQVESYFKVNKLLYQFQSGFRSGFSTDTCLIHLRKFHNGGDGQTSYCRYSTPGSPKSF